MDDENRLHYTTENLLIVCLFLGFITLLGFILLMSYENLNDRDINTQRVQICLRQSGQNWDSCKDIIK